MLITRILVLGHDLAMSRAVCRTLHEHGYQVFAGASPREALEVVRNWSPIDLVVSDFSMPKTLGTQLVRHACQSLVLRQIVRLRPQTACLFITAGGIKPAHAPDGMTVLKKPFSRADLIAAVEATLARLGNRQS
jgi:CheY-like chemotaxis protein